MNRSSAKLGISRWAAIPPAFLIRVDSPRVWVTVLTACGITVASRAHSGIQPIE
ncbi:Uncharacterised protein [Mycobacterium tuberculosis]|nr:Uncharacterised protein [Mycobacterium tuberculosis]